MFKTHDVMELMSYGINEIDGKISDKPDDNGNYELYFSDVTADGNIMYANFTTEIDGKIHEDKYKITVELVEKE